MDGEPGSNYRVENERKVGKKQPGVQNSPFESLAVKNEGVGGRHTARWSMGSRVKLRAVR